jgi:uncharacterized integral membrane protein (TIGR00698 family)
MSALPVEMLGGRFFWLKRYLPGLALIASLVTIAFAISQWQSAISPLALSVAFGFLVANLWKWPEWAKDGSAFAGKRILRSGVVLLGVQVSLSALRAIGIKGLAAIIIVVIMTIFGILALSKVFGLSEDLGMLIACGFAICGASAIAAVRPQTKATEEETSYAIGLVSLCGTLSIFVLPLIGHAIGLSNRAFGSWAGAAVHDVGQVLATASLFNSGSVESAIIFKLARVCLLAPIIIILSLRNRKLRGGESASGAQVPLVPLFVLGFVAVALLHNAIHTSVRVTNDLGTLSKVLISAGLVALGSNVRWAAIRRIGHKPLVMGLFAWGVVAGLALGAVKLTGL